MPIQGRLSIKNRFVEVRRRAVAKRSPLASFVLVLGVVAPATACAVATDDSELTSTEADALRLPPGSGGGGGIGTHPPFPSIGETLVEISAGKNHTCVRKLNGKVYCWGLTRYGQAGPSSTTCLSGSPCVMQPSFTGITAIQVELGYDHTCVVDSVGAGRCWGANHNAQLGNGSVGILPTFPASSQPVLFNGAPLSFSMISAGDFSVCGVTNGARNVFCWGSAGPGGFSGPGVPTPNPLMNEWGIVLDNIGSVSTWFAGGYIQFNLTTGGTDNYFFRGMEANGRAHFEPAFDQGATRISAQRSSACADKTNGTVECFGYNGNGELGDGTQNNSNVPVTVGGGMALHGVSSGESQACALNPSGTAFCWGNAANGGSLSPVAVTTPVPLTAVAAGEQHACGLGNDGHIYCWGHNENGQLGTGAWQNTTLPAVQALDPS